MSSNINPNNIDTTYPIAGQDNDSQGFRDNFTNIKTNFQYAENEIDDLQTNVVLKSALTGTTLDNDMGGSLISNALIRGFRGTRTALGASSTLASHTAVIDYSAAHFYTVSMDSNCLLDFANWPSAGNESWVRVTVTVTSTAYTLTFPAAVSVGTSNIQGLNTSTGILTFNKTGTYAFEFTTSDGGTTITVQDLNRNLDPIYLPSSEDLAPSTAASLATTASYFTTAAAETATLAAGYTGQIKTFMAVDVTAGNMVVTVTNAGWKASGTGTMTFTGRGQGCTLQYIDSKWFCIGNNGVTFG